MKQFKYDLHIHSALSPCGDREMTPNSIAGMAKLTGRELLALTDHNSCRNCPAFFTACRRYEIIPVPGCELTTAEDIHAVLLFPALEAALDFDHDLQAHRILYPNRPALFGEQIIFDDEDHVIGEEANILTNATDIGISEVATLALRYGGVGYPAHIDRESNGMIAVLGDFPQDAGFTAYELHFAEKRAELADRYSLGHLPFVTSSDAHLLWDISDGDAELSLAGETEGEVRESLIRYLRGEAR